MNLFNWRMQQNLTQAACAARVGVDQGLWSKWERGVGTPSLAYAVKLVEVTGGAVTLEELAKKGPVAR